MLCEPSTDCCNNTQTDLMPYSTCVPIYLTYPGYLTTMNETRMIHYPTFHIYVSNSSLTTLSISAANTIWKLHTERPRPNQKLNPGIFLLREDNADKVNVHIKVFENTPTYHVLSLHTKNIPWHNLALDHALMIIDLYYYWLKCA